jgi:hypothetical protein
MKTSIIGVPEDQKPEVAQRVNHSFLWFKKKFVSQFLDSEQ